MPSPPRPTSTARTAARILVPTLLLSACLAMGRGATAETPVPRRSRNSIYHPPLSLRYVAETDEVVRQTSVFNGEEPFPGGTLGYYGNRLTQFRFRGPPGQGGIYDAFEQERRERPLDPAKYRYRWRY